MGIGGGTLMVPVLTLVIGLPQKIAQGTALAAMVLPAMMGCYTYLSKGCVKLHILPGLLTGVSVGASLGGKFFSWAQQSLPLFCLGGGRNVGRP